MRSAHPYSAVLAHASVLVVFGCTVSDILSGAGHVQRDLDLVELWSGVGSVVAAGQAVGLQCRPFDRDRPGCQVEEDILLEKGFRKALSYVLRLKPGGLLWAGVVCSSFVFANSINCQRTADNRAGNLDYDKVRDGNLMADIAAFFMIICVARKVHCALENPEGSQLFTRDGSVGVGGYIGPMLRCIRGLVFGSCERCAYDDGPYPRIGRKAYKFLATGSWIQNVNKKCHCPEAPAERDKHLPLMVRHGEGGSKSSGTPFLKASQAYPRRLGEAITSAWLAHVQPSRPLPFLLNPPFLQARNPGYAKRLDAPGKPAGPKGKRPRVAADTNQIEGPWSDSDGESSSGAWGIASESQAQGDESHTGPWNSDSDADSSVEASVWFE